MGAIDLQRSHDVPEVADAASEPVDPGDHERISVFFIPVALRTGDGDHCEVRRSDSGRRLREIRHRRRHLNCSGIGAVPRTTREPMLTCRPKQPNARPA